MKKGKLLQLTRTPIKLIERLDAICLNIVVVENSLANDTRSLQKIEENLICFKDAKVVSLNEYKKIIKQKVVYEQDTNSKHKRLRYLNEEKEKVKNLLPKNPAKIYKLPSSKRSRRTKKADS